MYLQNRIAQRKFSHCEDLADLNYYIRSKEELHFPEGGVSDARSQYCPYSTHLRPTAAAFRSDRHRRNAVTTIAIPHSIIEPRACQLNSANLRTYSSLPKFPK